ncbi:hypothetical protein [Candidatus Mycoplasma haematohominis]|uniref:Uncharacterized protein n=1 Tax=Candidatus Mycoplasma haematohominis TaxID=1494318 RepID=A0A478FRL1_9MOLU|nr:hypothetical protein [Candidatus Mycoplasma haemohominis]GCE63694.1 hypothetical protein MHSWG343_06940 [Candidatus Mycoplasma haemohominis]
MLDTWLSLLDLADLIFDDCLSSEDLSRFDTIVFNNKLTVKDRFIAHFDSNLRVPAYDYQISRIKILEILESDSLDNLFKKEGTKFNFSAFDCLFRRMNFFEKSRRGL